MVFGMGYLLIPSYFERVLDAKWPPAIQLGLTGTGTGLMAVAFLPVGPPLVERLGEIAWVLGVIVFLGTILWTIRDNLAGRETGTGAGKEELEWVDRYANPFMIVALGYVLVGSYELLAHGSPLPGITDGYVPRVSHLLAAGGATLLVFTLGVRIAPRFLGVPARKELVAVVLPAGAFGPALLAYGLGGGPAFIAGAIAEATAMVGFGGVYGLLFARSDRRTVGLFGVLAGVGCGIAGVSLGLSFAFGTVSSELVTSHLQLNLLGFLGLCIIGFAMQFFPPTAGRFKGATETTVWLVIVALLGGLVFIVVGTLAEVTILATAGNVLALTGAVVYSYLVIRLMIAVGSR
ncbi:hypothetical protein [Halobaculum magnesiiphilum]|uniref:Uncharacterized protein n=1 Tax=Halobaculum magnesiiphilum TaxID=1017351 RepID=A0A8T8WIT9_9EURY|nr:hypothetical protein [Halobaculum magnesiiphilum]QZP39633.1 hypothetical protein K6T50_16720 [Halobaculum magnesiiphilum]